MSSLPKILSTPILTSTHEVPEIVDSKLTVNYEGDFGQVHSVPMDAPVDEWLFVHLARYDKVAQAVSLAKAIQAQQWHLDKQDEPAVHDFAYDEKHLAYYVLHLGWYEHHYAKFFESQNVQYELVCYEFFSASRERMTSTTRRILESAGLPLVCDTLDELPLVKQRDTHSLDWMRKFSAHIAEMD